MLVWERAGHLQHGLVRGGADYLQQGWAGLPNRALGLVLSPAIFRYTVPILFLYNHSIGFGVRKDFPRGTSDTRQFSHITATSGLRWESRGAPAYPAWGQARSWLTEGELWENAKWEAARVHGYADSWPACRLCCLGSPGGPAQMHCSLGNTYI